jgi:hypothetical protein
MIAQIPTEKQGANRAANPFPLLRHHSSQDNRQNSRHSSTSFTFAQRRSVFELY